MSKSILIKTAALLGLIAVILGALGAHTLESSLDADSLDSFETGVRYQMYHALALLALAAFSGYLKSLKLVYWFWLLGTILFSGSIYMLATRELHHLAVSFLGPVTPFGGLLLIVGWLLLFLKGAVQKSTKAP